jgi:hypothetical protein
MMNVCKKSIVKIEALAVSNMHIHHDKRSLEHAHCSETYAYCDSDPLPEYVKHKSFSSTLANLRSV